MNYEEFIKNYHGFSPFADNIGLKLTAMSDGHCEGEVPVTPALFNPIGTIHHNDRRQAQPYPRGYEQR